MIKVMLQNSNMGYITKQDVSRKEFIRLHRENILNG